MSVMTGHSVVSVVVSALTYCIVISTSKVCVKSLVSHFFSFFSLGARSLNLLFSVGFDKMTLERAQRRREKCGLEVGIH